MVDLIIQHMLNKLVSVNKETLLTAGTGKHAWIKLLVFNKDDWWSDRA